MVVWGRGDPRIVNRWPTSFEPAVLDIEAATRTAPSMFSIPAPCWKRSGPSMICAVYIRIALTRLGVREGLAWNISAAATETTPADIEVPLRIDRKSVV